MTLPVLGIKSSFTNKRNAFVFSKIVMVMINGNRTLCRPIRSVIIIVTKQIGLPLGGCPILLITGMITDRIGLHSVLIYYFIIPLLRHFTIFGQENAQNMRR